MLATGSTYVDAFYIADYILPETEGTEPSTSDHPRCGDYYIFIVKAVGFGI